MNYSKLDLVGTWRSSNNTLTLLSDGRFTFRHENSWFVAILPFSEDCEEWISGVWDFVDSSLTFQSPGKVLQVWKIHSVEGVEMVLSDDNRSKVRYKRE